MKNDLPKLNKSLVPFDSRDPLVPGKGGGQLKYWRQARDNEQLKFQLTDLVQVLRRLSQELIEQALFLQNPEHKSPEAIARRLSGIFGALKTDSSTLSGLFQIEELHPALSRIFLNRMTGHNHEPLDDETIEISLPPPPVDETIKPRKTIFHLLTEGELEFVTLLLAGHSLKEIPGKMKVRNGTVWNHLRHVKEKAKQILGESEPTNEGNS